MTVRLITGPPGAGKNTYIEKHMKDGDFVFDFDVLRQTYPHMTFDQLKAMRETIYGSLQTIDRDAWVIQCVARGDKRAEIAQKIGAEEVVVLETPAHLAKERVKERNREPERNDEVFTAIDDWWSQYGVVESDLIVRPDTGQSKDSDRKKNMPDLEDLKSGTESDKGFPAETKIVDMTPEQQAAYWRFQSRKHEGNAKDLRTQLEAKNQTPETKPETKPDAGAPIDAEALRKQIIAELKREQAPDLVRNQFVSLIGNRLNEDTRDGILEDLNFDRYVKADGSVDVDRIKAKAELIAPVAETRSVRKVRPHQGERRQDTPSSVQAGRDLFEAEAKKNRRSN